MLGYADYSTGYPEYPCCGSSWGRWRGRLEPLRRVIRDFVHPGLTFTLYYRKL